MSGRTCCSPLVVLLLSTLPCIAAEDPAFRPFQSKVLRGGDPAQHVRLPVAGVEQLSLIAEGVPNYNFGHADWGDAKLIDVEGNVTYLSDLKPIHVDQPYGTPRRDRSHRGGPIQIGGRQFDRGLGTHAPTEQRFALDGRYAWLEVWIGIDATAGDQGHVRFTITNRPVHVRRMASKQGVDPAALRRAIADLIETFGPKYPRGGEYLTQLTAIESRLQHVLEAKPRDETAVDDAIAALVALQSEALMANPLLDFDKMLLVRRRAIRNGQPGDPCTASAWDMGLPRSSHGNSSLPPGIHDNAIVVLSPAAPDGKLTTLFQPPPGRFVGDVDLHFDAERMLFSMRDEVGCFQVYEIRTDGTALRQVTRCDRPDVDNYDACYLPEPHDGASGGIVFCSTACFQGVPCNKSKVAVLYRAAADGSDVRQLCFEQDHDTNPTMLPGGRVLYLRWEYTDLPHSNSRILFSMNPDGTGQMEYYGRNSYWPNAIFGARPIPGRPGMFAGIVAGHHGSHREGELVVFDAGRGRHEADGAVQRIPGFGQSVEPLVRDELTAASWPKFAHPFPLSEKYFLAACKLHANAPWDVYLVDVFDNLLPLVHLDGYGLFEPIPLRRTPKPPAIPKRVDPTRDDAVVLLSDVYRGPGLAGVPRGTVKRLRLMTYHFAYQGMGGLLGTVGLDGPWDIKRVLGTVPVRPDGSALFRVPANTPISVQPLDAEGKALQLMRSWFVGMPGETLSCVGCHEPLGSTPPLDFAQSGLGAPEEISPWLGGDRNFSFKREVQPVVDHHCVGCHDGRPNEEGGALPDLRGTVLTADYQSHIAGNGGGAGGRYFSVGYYELARRVRRPGIESDMHLLKPLEYHADTTQLVQLLAKGHQGVQLDAESWRRLITWIDLNTPYHGTWTEIGWDPGVQRERRRELRKLYAGVDEDPEALAAVDPPQVEPIVPQPPPPASDVEAPACPGWPFDAEEAVRRQAAAARNVANGATRLVIKLSDGWLGQSAAVPQEIRQPGASLRSATSHLETISKQSPGDGLTMTMTLIPPGRFVMGDPNGLRDERPASMVAIERPFWIGTCEVTNRQFAAFDPTHDSRFESKNGYQFGVTGFDLSGPDQPVVRVSWTQAMAFCRWLSQRTGRRFTLPTEAQWEYACRAGTASAFSYGGPDDDFSPYANLADAKLKFFATDPYTIHGPLPKYTRYDDWIPRDGRFDDGGLVTVPVGRYRPNPWGLYDMHGNAAEWTRSTYRPYPYDVADGREQPDAIADARKVVRGGSWRDRPARCRSAYRVSYPAWQGVYNVGFRVVCQTAED